MISGVTSSIFSVNRLIAALGNVAPKSCSDCGETSSQQKLDAAQDVLRSGPVGKSELTEEEKQQVKELEQRDAEVRRHEQAHKAAAGSLATSGPSYEYQRGPDGSQYAVGGEVQIDTSEVSGDPQATIEKMEQVRKAALAPAEPSSQDRQVAAKAAQIEQKARAELREQRAEEDSAAIGATGKAGSANEAASVAGGLAVQSAIAPRATNASESPRAVEFKALLNLQQALVPGRFIDVAV